MESLIFAYRLKVNSVCNSLCWCYLVLRNYLKIPLNEDAKESYNELKKGTNPQFDRFNITLEALRSDTEQSFKSRNEKDKVHET